MSKYQIDFETEHDSAKILRYVMKLLDQKGETRDLKTVVKMLESTTAFCRGALSVFKMIYRDDKKRRKHKKRKGKKLTSASAAADADKEEVAAPKKRKNVLITDFYDDEESEDEEQSIEEDSPLESEDEPEEDPEDVDDAEDAEDPLDDKKCDESGCKVPERKDNIFLAKKGPGKTAANTGVEIEQLMTMLKDTAATANAGTEQLMKVIKNILPPQQGEALEKLLLGIDPFVPPPNNAATIVDTLKSLPVPTPAVKTSKDAAE